MQKIVFIAFLQYLLCIVSFCDAAQTKLQDQTIYFTSSIKSEDFRLEIPHGTLIPKQIKQALEIFIRSPDVLDSFLKRYSNDTRDNVEVKQQTDQQYSCSVHNSINALDLYSYQNSLIELLNQRITNYVLNPLDTSLCEKIERIVSKLLSDPNPDLDWILSLISELKLHPGTTEFYNTLCDTIQTRACV